MGVEPPFCGIERANFAGKPEDQHPHPVMVAVLGEMLAVSCFFGLAKGVGQKKDRNNQTRVHLHALHDQDKKTSGTEATISLANSKTYCAHMCKHIRLWDAMERA